MNVPNIIKRNSTRLKHLLLHQNRLVRIRRYLRFRNAQRMLRLARNEMSAHVTVVRARPVYMNFDTGPLCNLKCPFCCTVNGLSSLKRELLRPDVFNAIVRNLPLDSLYQVGLFNWGEPLLNPHLLDYIRFFARKGIYVVIHTNFSINDYDESFMEALIRSGISEVTVSVDGASQEVYEKYRVGGDLRRVIANMELLARTKHRMKSETPLIVYKMLLHRFNQHEEGDARRIAESMGVEFLAQENLGTPDAETRAEWTATRVLEKYGNRPVSGIDKGGCEPVLTECRQMWETLIVNADGAVFPCCLVYTPESAVGNLATQCFEDVWNGKKMVALRQYVLDRKAEPPGFPNSCVSCPLRSCQYNSASQLAKHIS